MSEQSSDRANGSRNGSARPRSAPPSPAALAKRACAELGELLGRDPEGVVSLKRTDDGWEVGIEVVETRRIPDTADIIAEYAVELNAKGRLVGYERSRRYARGSVMGER